MKYLLRLLVLLLVVAVLLPAVASVEAQCTPRADWGTYTVVRGDTLNRIAQGNGISVSALMQGNCLTSTRILVGQQLRVPGAASPTPASVVEQPGGTFFVGATYRTFESGWMVWRSDNGSIFVFTNNGTVRSYPLSRYGALAIPRNPPDQPPANRFRPGDGFGKLWHNFPEVRQALGWSLDAQERPYNIFFQTPSFGQFYTMTLWDNNLVRVNPDGSWTRVTATPTPTQTGQPAVTTGATFQPFERGFMAWRADTGDIYVFVGEQNGPLTFYSVSQYAGLPLTGGFTAPSGLQVPVSGFGRIWRNDADLRNRIGYATTGERGYTMALQFATPNNLTGFSLPDQRFIYGSGSGTNWVVAGDYYAPTFTPTFTATATGPTPQPTATHTLTPSATFTGSEPRIGTSYQPFENGFMLWRADTSDIWVFLGGTVGEIAVIPNSVYGALTVDRRPQPPPGRLRPDNGFGRVWSNFRTIRDRIGWATSSESGYLMTARLLNTGDTWSFSLPDGRFVTRVSGTTWQVEGTAVTPTATPTANAPIEVSSGASFQPFDGGFMVWLASGGQIVTYLNATNQATFFQPSQYGALPIDRATPPPPGRFRPDNGFGRVWSNFPDIRQSLGWATANETGYTALLLLGPGTGINRITLPGGALLESLGNGSWRVTGLPVVTPSATVPTPTASATATATATVGAPPPVTTSAVFQCFQGGYMLRRADTGQVLGLTGRNGGSAAFIEQPQYASLPDAIGTPTEQGLLVPTGNFGRVWGGFESLRMMLGWATAAEQTYDATIGSPGDPQVLRFGIPNGGTLDVNFQTGQWSFPSGGNTLTCP